MSAKLIAAWLPLTTIGGVVRLPVLGIGSGVYRVGTVAMLLLTWLLAQPRRTHPLDAPLLTTTWIFTVWSFSTLLWSSDFGTGVGVWINLGILAWLVVTSLHIGPGGQWLTAARTGFGLSWLANAVLGAIEVALGTHFHSTRLTLEYSYLVEGVPLGLWANPNDYALALTTSAVGVLVCLNLEPRRSRLPTHAISWVPLILSVPLLVAARSRTLIVAVCGIILLEFLRRRVTQDRLESWRARQWLGVLLVGSLMIALAIVATLATPPLQDRIGLAAEAAALDPSLSNRVEVFSLVPEIGEGDLVVGFGLGSFQQIAGRTLGAGAPLASHNLGLQLLVDTGLVGVVAYGAILVALIRMLARRGRGLLVMTSPMLLLLASGSIITSGFLASPIHFVQLLFLIWAAFTPSENERWAMRETAGANSRPGTTASGRHPLPRTPRGLCSRGW